MGKVLWTPLSESPASLSAGAGIGQKEGLKRDRAVALGEPGQDRRAQSRGG